jgi:hypothetical protein
MTLDKALQPRKAQKRKAQIAPAALAMKKRKRQDNDEPIVVDNGPVTIYYGRGHTVTPSGSTVTRNVGPKAIDHLLVTVTDSGGGLPSEELDVSKKDVVLKLLEGHVRSEAATLTFSVASGVLTTTLAGAGKRVFKSTAANRVEPDGVQFRVTQILIGGVVQPIPFTIGTADNFIWQSVRIEFFMK